MLTIYHLTPDGDRWTLTKEGSDALVGNFATKDEAITKCANHMANRDGSLKIHRLDGSVEQEYTYPTETNQWISEYTYSAAGIAFAAGILAGFILGRQQSR